MSQDTQNGLIAIGLTALVCGLLAAVRFPFGYKLAGYKLVSMGPGGYVLEPVDQEAA